MVGSLIREVNFLNTKETIINVSIELFGLHGYEGASMEAIANKVGVKKGSLYAHFSGKSDIYMGACNQIISKVEKSITELLSVMYNISPEKKLYTILEFITIESDYLTSEDISFVKRSILMTDNKLCDLTLELFICFQSFIEKIVLSIFNECLAKGIIKKQVIENAMSAYLFLINNIYTESNTNPLILKSHLQLLWQFYWTGVVYA